MCSMIFLLLKIAGLKLNASNFHKFLLNWFWIAQLFGHAALWSTVEHESLAGHLFGFMFIAPNIIIGFNIEELSQLEELEQRTALLHLLLGHIDIYCKRSIISPGHHKVYVLLSPSWTFCTVSSQLLSGDKHRRDISLWQFPSQSFPVQPPGLTLQVFPSTS